MAEVAGGAEIEAYRDVELRVIEQVEEFGAELQRRVFVDAADPRRLRQGLPAGESRFCSQQFGFVQADGVNFL
jgi:hypothetical protein